jgi:predicted metal-dependent phosphoesterase TrpH
MEYVDLHIHTTASDSTFTPEEVVRLAVKLGFRAIAITDHDTTLGIAAAQREGEETGLEVLPGIELTIEHNDREMHLLGYGIQPNDAALLKTLAHLREVRRQRVIKMAQLLEDLGAKIDVERVLHQSQKDGALGRLHVANELVRLGHSHSIEHAMNKYLRKGRPAFVQKLTFTPAEGIRLIRQAGGVTALAHPGMGKMDQYLLELMRAGLQGLEVYHPNHTPDQTKHYLALAKKHGLLITGGSDDHGHAKEEVLLGKIRLDYVHYETLKSYIQDAPRRLHSQVN